MEWIRLEDAARFDLISALVVTSDASGPARPAIPELAAPRLRSSRSRRLSSVRAPERS